MAMKVTIAVNGRFHGFDLAAQLHVKGHLRLLITTYPYYKVKEWGIPREKVYSLVFLEVYKRLIKKFPDKLKNWFSCKQVQLFDYFVSFLLPRDTEIFVGWSASSLKAIKKAKSFGAVTVLERGSSHMRYQNKILAEEYKLQSLRFTGHHPVITNREISEYEIVDYISIPSKFVKRTFLEQGISESKLIHNPYGVDLSDFYRLKKEDEVFRIIFAGGLIIRKGVQYLLQAFYELNLEKSELWLLGTPSKEMERYIQKYNNGHVILHGHQPQSKLNWFYSQCSAFCHPSIEEGLSMVQIQAMSCCLPLICTTNTGGDDLVDNNVNGFVVDIRDINGLKEKITYLYENKKIAEQMGLSACEKVRSGFSWRDYGERMINEYDKILIKKDSVTQ
ncbi:MAG: glycosyltransferase family 4 protein [Sedimenticola sp.]